MYLLTFSRRLETAEDDVVLFFLETDFFFQIRFVVFLRNVLFVLICDNVRESDCCLDVSPYASKVLEQYRGDRAERKKLISKYLL